MTEAEFQGRVCDYALLQGWRLAHFRPARTERGWRTPMTGQPGFPDLVLVRRDHLRFVELKAERGVVRPEQRQWLDALSAVPWIEVNVWRPPDWPQILQELR